MRKLLLLSESAVEGSVFGNRLFGAFLFALFHCLGLVSHDITLME